MLKNTIIFWWFMAVLSVTLFVFFGHMLPNDHAAAADDFNYYCDMVNEGHWPDYKNQLQYCE